MARRSCRNRNFFLLLVAVVVSSTIVSGKEIEDYVNILGGTSPSSFWMSHGNTLPLIARPWGFNHWAPQTNSYTDGSDTANKEKDWWFNPTDYRFYGLRLTHQPSPWIKDWAYILFQAKVQDYSHFSDNYPAGYDPNKATFTPYYFKTLVPGYADTTVEMTPTNHGAMMRAQFVIQPEVLGYTYSYRVGAQLPPNGVITSSGLSTGVYTITGYSTECGGTPSNYKLYFTLKIFIGENGDQTPSCVNAFISDDGTYGFLDLCPIPNNVQVTMKIGTSLISQAQASLNLDNEIGSKTFDELVDESRQEWHNLLSRAMLVDVGDFPSEQVERFKTTFYTAMYRASLFPRQISEIDATGTEVHWSPFDQAQGIYQGPLSVDSGFWDAYVAVYGWHTLVNRDVLGSKMLTGFLNAYKEGGWLPKWPSPGYHSSMVGTMADISFSDAIVKNVPGFNVSLAYEAIWKDAFVIPESGVDTGRVCLPDYLNYGYIPVGGIMTSNPSESCYEIVSRSLNYMQSDWAIAQAANALGFTSDSEILLLRAQNYSKMFDGSTGFFRPTKKDGSFDSNFDPYAWGQNYTEGGPWQYRFYVPYDPTGLAALYSSNGPSVCQKLVEMQTTDPLFHLGYYFNNGEIHEQTEVQSTWGQYLHSNQHAHHVLYMFFATDPNGILGSCASQGMYWLRRTMTNLYKPGLDMFPGDEDNGEMSSWFLLSSIGLYELSPGSDSYTLGAPLFAKVVLTIDPDTGKTLTIEAPGNGAENIYVQGVAWNGELLTGSPLRSIKYATLMEGGTLTFFMGPNPKTKLV